jgi:hypothetical protein
MRLEDEQMRLADGTVNLENEQVLRSYDYMVSR